MRVKDFGIKYIKGKPPRIKEGRKDLPYLSPDYIRKNTFPEYYPLQPGIVLVEEGELILLWDGSNAGEFFKGKKGILSSTMVKIDEVEELDTDYFYYSLKLQESTLKSKTSGSGIPHVDKEEFYNLRINFLEKPQQKTVSKVLSTVDLAIDQTEKLIAKYERIKTGLMQDLLTKGIDEQGNIRSEETHEFKDSPLGRIPVEWEVIKLGNKNYFNLMTGGTPSTEIEEYWVNGFIPWMSSGEIHNKEIYFTENHITLKGLNKSNARYYPINSIVIALAGQGKTRGTVAITKIKLTSNQSIAAIVPNEEKVFHTYLFNYLNSKYENLRSSSSGAGRAGLSLKILSDYNILLPQLQEQQRIAETIESVRNEIKAEYKMINKLKDEKTALMQDLLTNKVSVEPLLQKEATII